MNYRFFGRARAVGRTLVVCLSFAAGGLFADEAYLQSSGVQSINTGYFANPKTKIVMDCAYVEATNQKRMIGAASSSAVLSCEIYINGSGYYAWSFKDGGVNKQSTGISATTDRRLFTLDSPGNLFEIKTEGAVTKSMALGTTRTKTSVWPLAIFACSTTADGSTVANNGKLKCWGLGIYEDGMLVKAFAPYQDETKIGMIDLVSRQVYEKTESSAAAFTGANLSAKVIPTIFADDFRYDGDTLQAKFAVTATNGTVSVDGGAAVTEFDRWADQETEITLTATPANGRVFERWEGDTAAIVDGYSIYDATVKVRVKGPVSIKAACGDTIYGDVSYYGDTNGNLQVVKLDEGTNRYVTGVLNVGTEQGGAMLVATGATITVAGGLTVGYQVKPGYSSMTSIVKLVRSRLTTGGTVWLGNACTGKYIDFEIGEGSVVTGSYVYFSSAIFPTLRFTGGRLVTTSSDYLFRGQGSTCTGGWPNPKLTVIGEGAPIDLTVKRDVVLFKGNTNRGLYLRGTGGLVKRGAGCLTWLWQPYGTKNAGNCPSEASYTGDTHIMEGGLKLGEIKDCYNTDYGTWHYWRYQIPPKSPLKLDVGTYFDVASNVSTWCSISGAGFVTNSAKTVATLRFGDNVADGELNVAGTYGSLNVVKVGLGTLTLAVPKIEGTLFVSNGFVRVTRGTSLDVEKIVICKGAVFDARGATVTYGALENEGKFVADSSTELDVTEDVTGTQTNVEWGIHAAGTFTKTGSGLLTLLGSCVKSNGTIRINGGTLRCEPYAPFHGTYYRIQYWADAVGDTSAGVGFSEFSLYDECGVRINQGDYLYTRLDPDPKQKFGGVGGIDDATQLAEREVAVWMPNHDGYFQNNDTTPKSIFDGNLSSGMQNTYYWDASNILVFRIPDGSEDLLGFTFTTLSWSAMRRPNAWKLEGSPDGITWTTLAYQPKVTGDAWIQMTNSTPSTIKTEYNNGLPMALNSYQPTEAYSVFGPAKVSVAPGATLNLPSDLQLLENLEIDCETGAGTITKFGLLPGATISLVHAPDFTSQTTYELPVTINEMTSTRAELRAATIVCDGVVNPRLRLHWNAATGKLSCTHAGTLMLLK